MYQVDRERTIMPCTSKICIVFQERIRLLDNIKLITIAFKGKPFLMFHATKANALQGISRRYLLSFLSVLLRHPLKIFTRGNYENAMNKQLCFQFLKNTCQGFDHKGKTFLAHQCEQHWMGRDGRENNTRVPREQVKGNVLIIRKCSSHSSEVVLP